MTKIGEANWKVISGYLMAIMLTGLASWWSFGGGVRAEDVKKMIQESPSVVQMNGAIERVQKDVDSLKQQVERNNDKTQGKLDVILEKLPRGGH